MPLPNHRVIPAGWSGHHRPTAEGQMTATGTLTVPASLASATFDETSGRSTVADATTIYTGEARIQRLAPGTMAVDVQAGERTVTLRQYRVSIPVDGPSTEVPVGAIWTTTVCDDDPDLVGKALQVKGVQLGSLLWQRDLFCEDNAPTTR